jgi:hypothetical protein
MKYSVPHHHYYFGRRAADISPWVEYFTGTLAAVFTAAREELLRCSGDGGAVALRRTGCPAPP